MSLSIGDSSFQTSMNFWTVKDKQKPCKDNNPRVSTINPVEVPAHPTIKENPLKKTIDCNARIQNLRPLLRKAFLNFKEYVVDSQEQAIQKLTQAPVGDLYIWPSITNKGIVSMAIKLESGIRSVRLFGPIEEIFTQAQAYGLRLKNSLSQSDISYLDFILTLSLSHKLFDRPNVPHSIIKRMFDQNKMIKSSLEVESALANAKSFDYRFWKSKTKTGAISYAVKLPWGLIDVRRVDACLWKPELIPSITRAGALLIELNKFFLDRAQKLEKNKRQYDQQLILNLGKGNTAKGLGGKAQENNLISNTIDLRNQISPATKLIEIGEDQQKLFKNLTHYSRLYVVGHCNKGLPGVFSDEGVYLSATALANALSKYATQLKQTHSEGNILRISLVACFGGKATNLQDDNSFCDELQREMNLHGIPCEILGRTDSVSRWDGRLTGYKKFVGGRHHNTGDKLIWRGNRKKELYVYPEQPIALLARNLDFIDIHSPLEDHILNLGEMSDKESEQLLQSYDPSTWQQNLWVLRTDSVTKQMMITTYANNQFMHQTINKQCFNLEQLIQSPSLWPDQFKFSNVLGLNLLVRQAMQLDHAGVTLASYRQ